MAAPLSRVVLSLLSVALVVTWVCVFVYYSSQSSELEIDATRVPNANARRDVARSDIDDLLRRVREGEAELEVRRATGPAERAVCGGRPADDDPDGGTGGQLGHRHGVLLADVSDFRPPTVVADPRQVGCPVELPIKLSHVTTTFEASRCPITHCNDIRLTTPATNIARAQCLAMMNRITPPPRSVAYATFVDGSDDFCRAAAVLSVTILNSTRIPDVPVLALVSNVSPECKGLLVAAGASVVEIDLLLEEVPLYFEKLHLFSFTQFDRIIFLDADMMMNNDVPLDDCFAIPGLAAPPAGSAPLWGELMIIEPSCSDFRRLSYFAKKDWWEENHRKLGWGLLRDSIADHPAMGIEGRQIHHEFTFFGAQLPQGLLYYFYGLLTGRLWRIKYDESHLRKLPFFSFAGPSEKPWVLAAETDHEERCKLRNTPMNWHGGRREEKFNMWNLGLDILTKAVSSNEVLTKFLPLGLPSSEECDGAAPNRNGGANDHVPQVGDTRKGRGKAT